MAVSKKDTKEIFYWIFTKNKLNKGFLSLTKRAHNLKVKQVKKKPDAFMRSITGNEDASNTFLLKTFVVLLEWGGDIIIADYFS